MDVSKLLEDARADPNLLSQIDVESLLLDSVKHDFLEAHTLDSIALDVVDSLKSLYKTRAIGRELLEEYCKKLIGYRYVDELHLLHKGKYVRWIRFDSPLTMSVGGVVVDIKFGDEGVNILCRLSSGRFIQYRFDRCMTYQKLSDEEQLILLLNEQDAI
jgi:hypothetical protein